MKFSIRDLMLVTVIVALALGWWVDRTRISGEIRELRKSVLRELGTLTTDGFRTANSSAPAPNDTVSTMVALLPGDWDALTLAIVVSLGEIGDARAIPALKAMENPEGVNVPGKIGAAVRHALKELESAPAPNPPKP